MTDPMSKQAEAHHAIERLDDSSLELVLSMANVMLTMDIFDQFLTKHKLQKEFRIFAESKFPGGKIPE